MRMSHHPHALTLYKNFAYYNPEEGESKSL